MIGQLMRTPTGRVALMVFAVVSLLFIIRNVGPQRDGDFGWAHPPPPPPHLSDGNGLPPPPPSGPSGEHHHPPPPPPPPPAGKSRGSGWFGGWKNEKSLLKKGAHPDENFGAAKNLVAENEESHYGPWIIDPPLPSKLETETNYTITFKCQYHADLCPERYAVFLRGPTIYSPDSQGYVQSEDKRTVNITFSIRDPGEYKLYAWPDFTDCPKWWRENMKYPFNRAQVQDTPVKLEVAGPMPTDEFSECTLESSESLGASNGRWIHRASLQDPSAEWAKSYPEDRDWLYAPYNCKRSHRSIKDTVDKTSTIRHIAFLGDSVTRGSFCRQFWPEFSLSGTPDGECTFKDDHGTYYSQPKTLHYSRRALEAAEKGNITLSYRFVNNDVKRCFPGIRESLSSTPTHVITNVGLWLSGNPPEEYREYIQAWLDAMFAAWPNATVIWRTTTDLAPMVVCYAEKLLHRDTTGYQRQVSMEVVEGMRKRGMRIFVVDSYEMTRARVDASYDGRHWVREDPAQNAEDELKAQRPQVDYVERAAVDAIWDILLRDDQWRRSSDGREALGNSASR